MLSRISETFRGLFSAQGSRAAEKNSPVQAIPGDLPQLTGEQAIPVESSPEDFRPLIGAYFEDLLSSPPSVDELAQNPLFTGVKRKVLRRVVEGSNQTPAQIAEALTRLTLPTPNRDGRRLLQQWSSRRDATTAPVAPRIGQQRDTSIPPPHTSSVPPQEEHEQVRRSLVIEGLNKSTAITNDEELRRLLGKAKSELSPDVVLDIVEQLRTQPPLDLFERHKKRVRGGPFKGYHEVRRGKTGRILFSIDEDGALHVRFGTHDEIYGTGKYKKDAARSL